MRRSPERGYAFKVKEIIKYKTKMAVCLCETARLCDED